MVTGKFTKAQQRRAEKLWNDLRSSFFTQQETFKTIIQERSWEALGFDSFAAAYSHYLSDIALAKELIPHVVYALLDEGESHEEIIRNVKGLSDSGLAAIVRQKQDNLPPGAVRRKPRKHPAARDSHLNLEFTPEEIDLWRIMCKDLEIGLHETAVKAVRDAMRSVSQYKKIG